MPFGTRCHGTAAIVVLRGHHVLHRATPSVPSRPDLREPHACKQAKGARARSTSQAVDADGEACMPDGDREHGLRY